MLDLDGFPMHSLMDFEDFALENGYDLERVEERFAALERFAHIHNYTVDELEEAWGI